MEENIIEDSFDSLKCPIRLVVCDIVTPNINSKILARSLKLLILPSRSVFLGVF